MWKGSQAPGQGKVDQKGRGAVYIVNVSQPIFNWIKYKDI